MQQQRKVGGDSAIRHLVMGTKRIELKSLTLLVRITKW